MGGHSSWASAVLGLSTLTQMALFTVLAVVVVAAVLIISSRLGFLLPRRRRDGSTQEPDSATDDPTHAIGATVRSLRIRYVTVVAAIAALGVLFVGVTHERNIRFSNATSMAVLVARSSEVADRILRAAAEMRAGVDGRSEWVEAALDVHARALAKIVMETAQLWAELDDDIKSRLEVTSPYGERRAIALLQQLHGEVAAAATDLPINRARNGRLIEGTIGFIVQPALDQQAMALRSFNRETALNVKFAINLVGAVIAALTGAILVLIFLPMEKSIRAALAKLGAALQSAKAADRAKSEFLANMSHEIRTPRTALQGMAELMAQTTLDNRQKTFNDVIVKSGNALLTIINDILDFSKIDAGHTELDPAPFRLREAVEDVVTLVSTRVSEKSLELAVRVDPDLPEWVVGDVGRIRQILTNLAGNAVKFTETGHVLVDVSRDGDAILFSVEDTGIGIPEDKLPSVFDKFSQVDASSTRRHEGTGLGLAIASRLVALMGGSIGAESRPGEGSTFRFCIPLVAYEPIETVAPPQNEIGDARILIVDDNAINRRILAEMARHWGFDACAVESGRLALAFLDHAQSIGARVDLVILDYQMPDMNGADVLDAIRARPGRTTLPVLLLTSVDHAAALRDLKVAGANAILTKPARSSLLRSTIDDALRMTPPALDRPTTTPARAVVQPTAPPDLPPSVTKGGLDRAIDILVAEDNEVNQLVFQQILGGLGYAFRIVGDGGRAVEAWRRSRPGLILMDVSMPDVNGFDATRRIRSEEAALGLGPTPIIGVTAHALKGDRERCLESGMDDYLTKPVSPDRLRAKIADWLDDGERRSA